MFALSLSKLILLGIVAAVVWYGLKYRARVEAIRRSVHEEMARRQMGARPSRSVEDLVKCPQCGAFVAATGATNCGKPQCPWGR